MSDPETTSSAPPTDSAKAKPARKTARKATSRPVDSPPEPVVAKPETATEPAKNPKNKRRRRGGKGKSQLKTETAAISTVPSEETPASPHPEPSEQPKAEERASLRNEPAPQPHKPRRKHDPEQIAKKAWKIFLSEVSEEGVALINDNDARELARRCFRLSEIFLDEVDRRG